jgi:hypothetical protein
MSMTSPLPGKTVRIRLALAAFLAGCAAPGQVLERDYAGQSCAGKKLVIMPVHPARVSVENADDVADDFSGDKRPAAEVLADQFGGHFLQALKLYSDQVKMVMAPDSLRVFPADSLITYSQRIGSAEPPFSFRIPSREYLRSKGLEADMALVVDSLSARLQAQNVLLPKAGGNHQRRSLVLKGWYVLWDFGRNRPVAYGLFRSEVFPSGRLDMEDWLQAFLEAGRAVVKFSPLKGMQWMKAKERADPF